MSEEEKMAEEHAEWAAQFFKWVYKQAFLHGWKHSKEVKGGNIKCQK